MYVRLVLYRVLSVVMVMLVLMLPVPFMLVLTLMFGPFRGGQLVRRGWQLGARRRCYRTVAHPSRRRASGESSWSKAFRSTD